MRKIFDRHKLDEKKDRKSAVHIVLSQKQLLFLDKECENLNREHLDLKFDRGDVIRALIEQHRMRRELDEYYVEDMEMLYDDKKKSALRKGRRKK